MLRPAATSTLSPRQRQLAKLLALGLLNKEIAAEMRISPSTVKNMVHGLTTRLDVRNRAQMVMWIAAHPQAIAGVPCRRGLNHEDGCGCAVCVVRRMPLAA